MEPPLNWISSFAPGKKVATSATTTMTEEMVKKVLRLPTKSYRFPSLTAAPSLTPP